MKVVVASILFALAQILLLLVLVKVLGASAYSTYSFYFTMAAAIAALTAEWVRLLVARYSGLRVVRVRGMILGTAMVWVGCTSAAFIVVGGLAGGLWFLTGRPSTGIAIATISVLTASSILGDCLATFMRFNTSAVLYLRYLGLRILASGALMLVLGSATGSAEAAALGFAGGVLAIALVFLRSYWVPVCGRTSFRRLLPFVPAGWAMAAGTISTNFTFAFSRLLLRLALPPHVAGAVFLALDLSTRGLNMLGVSFNTWSVKNLFDASHNRRADLMHSTAAKISALFGAVWLSAGVVGTGMAVVAPIVITGRGAYGTFADVAIINVLAVFLLMVRIFNFDTLMNAMGRYRVVSYSSLATIVVMMLAWIFPFVSLWALPGGVFLSFVVVIGLGIRLPPVRLALLHLSILVSFSSVALWWAYEFASAPTLPKLAMGVGLAAVDIILIVVLTLPLWRARTRLAIATS